MLQSWDWGEVQARAGWRVERLQLAGAGLASVQLRGKPPFERAYVPRGPVPADRAGFQALVDWARDRKLTRLRVEPETGPDLATELRDLGFQPAAQVQPQYTMVISLSGSEEDVLATTRFRSREDRPV